MMCLMTPEEFIALALASGFEDGAGFDLDETLSETNESWYGTLVRRFGNPEGLTSGQIIFKYRYYQRYWNTPEAHAVMNAMAASDELTLSLRPVSGALEVVRRVFHKTKQQCYITARPHSVAQSSLQWLKMHDFPSAPLITRPPEIPLHEGSRWKAEVLRQLFPHIRHFFDDSLVLLDHLDPEYKGRMYFLKAQTVNHPTIDVRACPTWREADHHFHS